MVLFREKLFGPLENRSQGVLGIGRENVLIFRTCSDPCPLQGAPRSCPSVWGRGQLGYGSESNTDAKMRQLLADKVAGSRPGGSIPLCWGVKEPGEDSRLQRGRDNQQDRRH